MLRKLLTLATLTVLATLMGACRSQQSAGGPADTQPASQSNLTPGLVPAPPDVQANPGQLVAYVDHVAVGWNELRNALNEVAGGRVLMELVLDREIARALASRGLKITDPLIDDEQAYFLSTLDPKPDQAQRLFKEVLERRGLGRERFQQLLARNAGLRLLAQEEVKVTDEAIQNEFALEYGPRYQARMILVKTLQEAGEMIRRTRAGESFMDLAIQNSIDVSHNQGGLLPPISPADPEYPSGVRNTLAQMSQDQVSEPVVIEDHYAVFKLEKKIEAADVKFDDVKKDLEVRVRQAQELRGMQRVARALLSQADVTVFDPVLNEGWQHQKKALAPQQ